MATPREAVQLMLERKGASQQHVAAAAGTTRRTLEGWLRRDGKSRIGLSRLIKIIRAAGGRIVVVHPDGVLELNSDPQDLKADRQRQRQAKPEFPNSDANREAVVDDWNTRPQPVDHAIRDNLGIKGYRPIATELLRPVPRRPTPRRREDCVLPDRVDYRQQNTTGTAARPELPATPTRPAG